MVKPSKDTAIRSALKLLNEIRRRAVDRHEEWVAFTTAPHTMDLSLWCEMDEVGRARGYERYDPWRDAADGTDIDFIKTLDRVIEKLKAAQNGGDDL